MAGNMVIVLMGPMGCGKTTIGRLLSKRLGWAFEDGDDFHPESNIRKMRDGEPLNDKDRLPWLQILAGRISETLKRQESMVLACSALKKNYRRILGINQENVLSVYLQGSPELLRQRIEKRNHHYMAKELLESQLRTLEEPDDGYRVSISGQPEEIVETIRSLLIERENNQK